MAAGSPKQLNLNDEVFLRDKYHAIINLISQVYGAKGIVTWLYARIPDSYSPTIDVKYRDRNLAFYEFIENSPIYRDAKTPKYIKDLLPQTPDNFNLGKMEALVLVKFPRYFFPVFGTTGAIPEHNHDLWHSKKRDVATNDMVEENLQDLVAKLNQYRIPADIFAIRIIAWLRNSYSHEAHKYTVKTMKFHLFHAQSAILHLLAVDETECENMERFCDILKSEKVMRELANEEFFDTINTTMHNLTGFVENFLKTTPRQTVFDHSTHDHSRREVNNIYNIKMADGVIVNFPQGFMRPDDFDKVRSVKQKSENTEESDSN